ncbi:hypothetical protein KUTeg_001976 [Tegillarca granosa]|uniref:Ion transport domain-containing protein n=1 Tax=Tegillarca granosa TaxID=220873 RepID=A0ABQ9FSZ0_TEGGR|nr:hypothetical protein KUTeg_001976 [Tegillarca granosa]
MLHYVDTKTGKTVKCESCEFKDECLHMQWILRQENAKETKKDEDIETTKDVFEKKSAMELCREMLGYYRIEKSKDHDNKEEPCSLEDLQNYIIAGICCAVLFKHLSEEASDAKEIQLSEELANHSEAFQKRCLMLMDKLYEFDPKTTTKIVKSVSTIWGITSSPIQFAHENKLYDIIMFLTMLLSYSSYVMTSIDDDNYQRIIARIWEYYTYFWAFGDLIEEIKRLSGGIFFVESEKSHRRWYMRLWHYIKDFWNLIDILSYILLIIALFVRHFYQSENYNIARRLFSLSLLVMYLRFLQIFFISHRLGTQLLMIKEMLKDLVDFLYVMIIIIVGVGIYYHANLFPNHLAIFGPGSFETWSFWKVFYYPYWQIYGETFNEYLEVNLVIAKFSYTFDEVQTNSVKLWKYQRYTLVTEYQSRIPSPFNILAYLFPPYWILKYCSVRCCCKQTQMQLNEKNALLNFKFQEIFPYISKN